MPARAKSLQMQYPSSEAPSGQHLTQMLASWGFGRLGVSVSLAMEPRLATGSWHTVFIEVGCGVEEQWETFFRQA